MSSEGNDSATLRAEATALDSAEAAAQEHARGAAAELQHWRQRRQRLQDEQQRLEKRAAALRRKGARPSWRSGLGLAATRIEQSLGLGATGKADARLAKDMRQWGFDSGEAAGASKPGLGKGAKARAKARANADQPLAQSLAAGRQWGKDADVIARNASSLQQTTG